MNVLPPNLRRHHPTVKNLNTFEVRPIPEVRIVLTRQSGTKASIDPTSDRMDVYKIDGLRLVSTCVDYIQATNDV